MFKKLFMTTVLALPIAFGGGSAIAQTANKPNILVIMADDIGWSNIGAYN
jgi:hypothetical protein